MTEQKKKSRKSIWFYLNLFKKNKHTNQFEEEHHKVKIKEDQIAHEQTKKEDITQEKEPEVNIPPKIEVKMKDNNILTSDKKENKERTPYEIGMYFGLTGTNDEKKDYAAKIQSEIDTTRTEMDKTYEDVKQYFNDLTTLTQNAQNEFRELFKDLQEHKKNAIKSIKDAFIATLLVGLDEKKKGEIAEKLIHADMESVSLMEKQISDYLMKLNGIMEQLTKSEVGIALYEKYKEAIEKNNSKSENIQQLEKGYAFGISIKKNLDS